ncbi:MAG: class I SAM-dependent DNA methyltransferase, partial [Methanobacteriaceae archaeon]|nr:class I SAM-dependent DNA methyltransferase [Methanobacteriaceae archaeon]
MAKTNNGANLGFEQKLWQSADKLRNNMDAAEYKHVVLGLIFLKYISDAFDEVYQELKNDPEGLADAEDKDEYMAQNVFWVPQESRWDFLQSKAKQPDIGILIDSAMDAIEKENPDLKGVLFKDYAKEALDKQSLGGIIDLISGIGLGDRENRSKDILGRVYEYFLGQFANAEGKKGGQFYTPRSIVKILVEMIEPYHGRVYDPCCGSGGMFVQSEKFVQAHEGKLDDIAVYGQESNQTTWRLCKINLAIRGIDSNIQWGNSFIEDKHPDLRADYILANPPFNDKDWKADQLQDDVRWTYGMPPVRNANFAWVQHFIHHLGPSGVAGFVLANGSMSAGGVEGKIRQKIVEDDLVDCMVALPGNLFYNTSIPACLWFLAKDKENGKFRDRKGEVLFIDARKLGAMADRTHRELNKEDVGLIADTYHAWRGEEEAGEYEDVRG